MNKHFEAAFKKMDECFKKMDECFNLVSKGFKSTKSIPVGTKIRIKKGSTIYVGNGITATLTNDVEAIIASTTMDSIPKGMTSYVEKTVISQ